MSGLFSLILLWEVPEGSQNYTNFITSFWTFVSSQGSFVTFFLLRQGTEFSLTAFDWKGSIKLIFLSLHFIWTDVVETDLCKDVGKISLG